MAVTAVDAGARKVSRTAVVAAPAAELFAVLADPRRHGEIDGSGTVRATISGPDRLSRGARFSVRMKQYGVPYRITSRVTELVPDRAVEWRHPAGHRWRWELAPEADGRTRVTETFDYSPVNGVQARLLELLRVPQQNAAGIEATLERLQQKHSG